jgi:hypothetical protein
LLFRSAFSPLFLSARHRKENPMKLHIKSTKPRNPFVVASLRRAAGSHRACSGARRQQAERALRQEVQRLRPSP